MEGGDLLLTTVDTRVVQMMFDNSQFEQRISQTLSSLEKLNKSLQLQGATKGLNEVATAASHQQASIKNVETGVQSLADRFKALQVVATTALVTITHQAISAGSRLVKALSIQPVLEGFREYETNMNSIQTILANTAHAGTTLNDVTAALDELNHYSDQTIYNFSEMARNIGTFTAAGVKLDTATAAIKGIANLAAVSGSNSQQASAAMYQLSQALAAGKVSLEDWNSVVNAGMGGKVFQDALMETARVHGVAIDKMVKDQGSFRLTLQEGWLTSDILNETLMKFTGDLNEAQLKTMGYNEKQIADIIKMGKIAVGAATEVKTLTQLWSTLKESMTSGWSKTWQLIFGDFNEAKGLFTGVSNSLGKIIGDSADARNKMLSDWKELGGRTALIDGISNAFKALVSVLKPIKDAFREIFPKTTAKELYEMTVSFRDFMERLKIGEQTAENLKRTFAGFFAILGIGWELIKAGASAIVSLIGAIAGGSGGVLKFTAGIGDFLVGIQKAIKQGDAFGKIFDKLGAVLAIPLKLLQTLGEKLGDLFDGLGSSGDDAAKSTTKVVSKLEPISKIFDAIISGGDKLNEAFGKVLNNLGKIASKVVEFARSAGETLTSIFESITSGLNFDDVLKGVNTGLLAGILLTVVNFIRNIGGGNGGPLQNISDAIEGLTDTLGALQNTLRAATLLQIAAAVGILAIAANTLSKIDADALKKSLAAIAGMFAQLLASMTIMSKIGLDGLISVSFGMILLATAINILTIAVKSLSELNWKELAKGLTGTAALLLAVAAAGKIMSGSKGLISASLGMIALAAAIRILVTAVTDLSGLSWKELAKGLTSVGALLLSLALFTRFAAADKGGLSQGLGILLLAAGIKILASAVEDFSKMSWGEIGKGLTVLAGALTAIGIALRLIPPTAVFSAAGVLVLATSLGMIGDAVKDMAKMKWGDIGKGLTVLAGSLVAIALALKLLPPSSLLSAAAILVVSVSLGLIYDALNDMASMSWGEIGKGLTVLAGSLAIIAGAVMLMTSALAGAAALLVVAGSLLILTPILMTYSQMSWEEIIKGLTMLAGVFVVLGAAGLLLAPLAPTLLILGAAITLLGVGVLAAGAGVLLFATGLTALAAAGSAAAAVLIAIVMGLIGLIPMLMEEIGKGIIAFAKVIAKAAPEVTNAIVVLLTEIIKAIVRLTPMITGALLQMLTMMLLQLLHYVPTLIDAGFKLLNAILNGIANNIGKVVTSATNVIVKFLEGISNNMPRIVQAGAELIIKFVNSVADSIRRNSAAMGDAGANLATAIVEGMIRGLASGVGRIASKAKEVAKSALNAAKSVLGINSPSKEFMKIGMGVNEGFADGMIKFSSMTEKAAEGVGKTALTTTKRALSGFPDILNGEFDLNPTITPVLDLSEVRNNASHIRSMLGSSSIPVAASYSSASDATSGYQRNREALLEDLELVGRSETPIVYNQYNSSPKALSEAEIYRQTKNQLSTTKEVLPK